MLRAPSDRLWIVEFETEWADAVEHHEVIVHEEAFAKEQAAKPGVRVTEYALVKEESA